MQTDAELLRGARKDAAAFRDIYEQLAACGRVLDRIARDSNARAGRNHGR
jgi:hypothetical protein